MNNVITFNKSVKGASHISSGKPCQDYSISINENGIQIVVVCDGHGGSSYCRSDIGARFASEITVDCLKNFANCIPETTFIGKTFSITAQPKRNPFIDADGNKLRYEELDETQQQYAKQARSYIESENKYPEQQTIVKDLINQIYQTWIKTINKDQHDHPFNKKERSLLNNLDVTKAYGCTLLAFLKTQNYWLAFQIGDGSIYWCDKKLSWRKPVPDDCACFLNYTTSLCDADPLIEFRYAFSGENDIPIAVMLCSDGVDGSLRTEENIQDFYEQIIGLYIDGDNIEEELQSYLPQLSESGNRDDISIAGIIDFSTPESLDIKKTMDLKKKSRDIKNKYRTKKSEIESISNKIESLQFKLSRQGDAYFMKQTELDDLRNDVKAKEIEVEEIRQSMNSIKKEISLLQESLKTRQTEFESWKFITKNEMAKLEAEQMNDNKNNIKDNIITNW